MGEHLDGVISRSEDVMTLNRRGNYTVPNHQIFDSYFLWDGGIIADGWAQIDPQQAANEILHSLNGQWKNGMIPNQFREGSSWPQKRLFRTNGLAPEGFTGSGYTQPPLTIHAAVEVCKKLDPEERARFAKHVFHPFSHYLKWFLTQRVNDAGLVVEIHPDEAGMDNTPTWNETLNDYWFDEDRAPATRLKHLLGMQAVGLGRRRFGDLRYLPIEQRASNREVLASYLQIREISKHDYDLGRIMSDSDAPLVISPGFNALIAEAGGALRELEAIIDDEDHQIEPSLSASIDKLSSAVDSELWHQDLVRPDLSGYYSKDARTGKRIPIQTVSGLVPLVGDIKDDHASFLVKDLLMNRRKFHTPYPIPSVAVDSEHFDSTAYWRGVAWPFMRYIVERGLRRHGFEAEAAELRHSVLTRPSESTKSEYDHPINGQGMGIAQFATAAALDVIFANLEKQKRYTIIDEHR